MKLRVLVAVHLVLAVSPLVMLFQFTSIWFMPVVWGAESVLIGQLMLLAFWAGLGTSGRARRIAGAFAGTGYVSFWMTAPDLLGLWISPNASWANWLGQLGYMFLVSGLQVLILSGILLIMRRWFSHLEHFEHAEEPPETFRLQFSIQHLLIITTVTAIFLASRRGEIEAMDYRLMIIAAVLMVGVFVANAIYAVRGTLRRGPIVWRLFLVFVVAVLLGGGLSIVVGHAHFSWWLVALFALTMTVPTLVVVLSLLVVRSCGYRLVPNAPAQGRAV